MTNAALTRKLQRLGGGVNQAMPGSMLNPRAFLEDEQDRSRTYLAAELLKIAAETIPPQDLATAAAAALIAATVIFPELPDEEVKP